MLPKVKYLFSLFSVIANKKLKLHSLNFKVDLRLKKYHYVLETR